LVIYSINPSFIAFRLINADYKWSDTQIEQFWEDVLSVINGSRDDHFFGAITVREVSDKEVEIIDGQHRLCTLSVLISVARDVPKGCGDAKRAKMLHAYLADDDPETLNPVPRLRMNSTNNPVYVETIVS
jgi:hypothetical protein